MAQQTINIGAIANDNTGDTLRGAGQKINDNFTELYTAISALNTATAYTPTLVDSGGGRTYTVTVNSARYTNIGNLRWFSVDLTVTAASGAASGDLRLSLPATSTYSGTVEFYADNLASAAKTDLQANVPAGANYAVLTHYENGDADSLTAHVQATSRLIVTGIFFTTPAA
jgi:hypothetical protein